VQQLRHDSDAILTGIGTVLATTAADRTARSGAAAGRCLRIVMDSRLRLPLDSKMATDAAAMWWPWPPRRRHWSGARRSKRAASACWFSTGRAAGPICKASPSGSGRERCLSLTIEAGSKVNWTALESGLVDRVFFYYGPKILGGLEALPLAGGIGRRRRSDAIRVHGVDDSPDSAPTNSPWKGYVDVHRDH